MERKSVLAAIAILSFLISIYIGGVIVAHKIFLPNTYINGQHVEYKTSLMAEDMLLPPDEDFVIEERGGIEEKIPFSSFDCDLYFAEPLEDIITAQSHFSWPLSFFNRTSVDNAVSIYYDKEKFEAELMSLDAFDKNNITEPKDAYIEKDNSNHYSIIPEVNGNELLKDKVLAEASKTIDSGLFNISFEETDCYVKPEIFSDDKGLNEKMQIIQALNEETITINLTDAEEELDALALVDFVNLEKSNELTVKEDVLAAYVSDLAAKYNTYLQVRQFKTHNGDTISVGGNHTEKYGIDTYGFLMNQGITTNELKHCILSGKDQTLNVTWDVPALTRDAENGDIGNTYIELSLNEQHLWFYKNGSVFYETDVVTGLDNDQRRTPWGVFRAYAKEKDCTLKGEMAGERWNTHVDYWISVTWTGCGIHDATWQPSFGGNRYKTAGSHGCINVPLDAARTLYENLEVDTPIIIY